MFYCNLSQKIVNVLRLYFKTVGYSLKFKVDIKKTKNNPFPRFFLLYFVRFFAEIPYRDLYRLKVLRLIPVCSSTSLSVAPSKKSLNAS